MTVTKIPKPQSKRVSECIAILTKLTDELKIPAENPSVRLLMKRMTTYWTDGKTQEDRIPLVGSNRYIMYRFPRWAHQNVDAILRVGAISHFQLPSNLQAELECPSNNAPQSDPAHPSPAELP
jgi:hypothetical protein